MTHISGTYGPKQKIEAAQAPLREFALWALAPPEGSGKRSPPHAALPGPKLRALGSRKEVANEGLRVPPIPSMALGAGPPRASGTRRSSFATSSRTLSVIVWWHTKAFVCHLSGPWGLTFLFAVIFF